MSRLVEQGEFLLKTFHAEYDKDPAGSKTEFALFNKGAKRIGTTTECGRYE
jgi:hypothetical protein